MASSSGMLLDILFGGQRHGCSDCQHWEPARPLQRSLRPPGPKCQKTLENVSRGWRPRDPGKVSQKSRGQSGNSPASLEKVSGECFWEMFPGLSLSLSLYLPLSCSFCLCPSLALSLSLSLSLLYSTLLCSTEIYSTLLY